MSNEIMKQRMISKIRHEDEDSRTVISGIDHNLTRGIFREYGFVEIIRNLLPKTYSIGKGIIVDTKNNQSAEADVIIYDNTDISPMLFGPDSGVFPLEACRYVVEMKSGSDATEIADAVGKFSKLKQMQSLNGQGPRAAYFAYSTDLTKKTEFDRYFENDSTVTTNSLVDVICVMNHGYWYKRNSFSKNGEQLNTAWLGTRSDGAYLEVLAFISGILNTLNQRTQLGYYLLEDDLFPFSYINFLKMGFEILPKNIALYNSYCIYEENQEYDKEIETLRKLVPDSRLLLRIVTVFGNDENRDPIRKQIYNLFASELVREIESAAP